MHIILERARRGGYAVGAFECWNSANIFGIAEAAAECGMPVILQASPVEYRTMGGPDLLRRIAAAYVEKTGITAALHLDHGSTLDHVRECVEAGFTSVMIDASVEDYERNRDLSAEAVRIAHSAGVSVEAELGHVGGSEGGIEDAGGDPADHLTNVEDAERFVRETGIDCLAVAIGTVHGAYRGEPKIDLERLEAIAGRVPQPLVLHGGSGTPPDKLRAAIGLGIAKINICTDIHNAWLDGIAEARRQRTPSIPGLFHEIPHARLKAKVKECIELFRQTQPTPTDR